MTTRALAPGFSLHAMGAAVVATPVVALTPYIAAVARALAPKATWGPALRTAFAAGVLLSAASVDLHARWQPLILLLLASSALRRPAPDPRKGPVRWPIPPCPPVTESRGTSRS